MFRNSGISAFVSKLFALAVVVSFGLMSVIGSGSGGGKSTDIAGVWTGTYSSNVYLCHLVLCVVDHAITYPALVLATPDRRLHLIPRDIFNLSGPQPYVQEMYVGRVAVSGNAVTGFLDSFGATCPDNSIDGGRIYDEVIIEALVTGGVALDGTWRYDRCIGSGDFGFDYDTASDQPASLPTISGLWLGGDLAINIDINGAVIGSNSSGCQFAGSVTASDPSLNVYEFAISISNCPLPGDSAEPLPLDGLFDGLGTILANGAGGRVLVISLTQQNRSAQMVLDG